MKTFAAQQVVYLDVFVDIWSILPRTLYMQMNIARYECEYRLQDSEDFFFFNGLSFLATRQGELLFNDPLIKVHTTPWFRDSTLKIDKVDW